MMRKVWRYRAVGKNMGSTFQQLGKEGNVICQLSYREHVL